MELEFKEAPPNFSVPYSGHPKTFPVLSSYEHSWHWSLRGLWANCSVAHLWTVCSLVPSDAKPSRAGWDNVWEDLLRVQNSSLVVCTDHVLAPRHYSLILTSEGCSCHSAGNSPLPGGFPALWMQPRCCCAWHCRTWASLWSWFHVFSN